MATCTLEFTTQVKYVSPPGAKFMTAHLHAQVTSSLRQEYNKETIQPGVW